MAHLPDPNQPSQFLRKNPPPPIRLCRHKGQHVGPNIRSVTTREVLKEMREEVDELFTCLTGGLQDLIRVRVKIDALYSSLESSAEYSPDEETGDGEDDDDDDGDEYNDEEGAMEVEDWDG